MCERGRKRERERARSSAARLAGELQQRVLRIAAGMPLLVILISDRQSKSPIQYLTNSNSRTAHCSNSCSRCPSISTSSRSSSLESSSAVLLLSSVAVFDHIHHHRFPLLSSLFSSSLDSSISIRILHPASCILHPASHSQQCRLRPISARCRNPNSFLFSDPAFFTVT